MSLDVGPNTPVVTEFLRRLSRVLFRPQQQRAQAVATIATYTEAFALARNEADLVEDADAEDSATQPDASHPAGITWTDLRVHHAAGLGEDGNPALPLTDKRVDALFTTAGEFVYAYLPAVWHEVLDDVSADLTLCVQWLALHGNMPVLPAWTASCYLTGGWPCGWQGGFPHGQMCVYYPHSDQAPLNANSARVEKIELEQAELRERLELALEL